jgi:uncharacterized protein YbaR (Trm112 family)
MTHCPDCRSPILSLMMLDTKIEPEYYCERCDHGFPVVKKSAPAPAPRRPALV